MSEAKNMHIDMKKRERKNETDDDDKPICCFFHVAQKSIFCHTTRRRYEYIAPYDCLIQMCRNSIHFFSIEFMMMNSFFKILEERISFLNLPVFYSNLINIGVYWQCQVNFALRTFIC